MLREYFYVLVILQAENSPHELLVTAISAEERSAQSGALDSSSF